MERLAEGVEEVTDDQIEAAAMAACDAANRYDGTWKVLDAGERKTWRLAARAALEAAERAAWQPIEMAPDDRQVAVWCPAREGLDELMSFCRHHPDAGFCVDELREPTLYRIVEPPRLATKEQRP